MKSLCGAFLFAKYLDYFDQIIYFSNTVIRGDESFNGEICNNNSIFTAFCLDVYLSRKLSISRETVFTRSHLDGDFSITKTFMIN